jgi:hypothetical protein
MTGNGSESHKLEQSGNQTVIGEAKVLTSLGNLLRMLRVSHSDIPDGNTIISA